MKNIIITLFLYISTLHASNIEVVKNVSISQLSYYSFEYGEGMLFTTKDEGNICNGYYISLANPDYSIIMTAYEMQSQEVIIYANNSPEWLFPVTEDKVFCKIESAYFSQDETQAVPPKLTSLESSNSSDTLFGNYGNDILSGGLGDDTYLFGRGDGIDTIIESRGSLDTLIFNRGISEDHLLVKVAGDNLIIALKEENTAWEALSDKVIITNWQDSNNSINFIKLANDTIISTEELITKQATPDNDTIIGSYDDDIIRGAKGNDILLGDLGNDIYIFNRGDGVDTIEDNNGENNELHFGPGIYENNLSIKAIDNMLIIALKEKNVAFEALSDKVIIKNWGANFDSDHNPIDTIKVNDAAISQQDIITKLTTDKDDKILGTYFDDTLQGGKGNDILQGGYGNDTYLFSRGDGIDTIEEYYSFNFNTLKFSAGITVENLTVKASNIGELTIALKKDSIDWKVLSDKVIIKNWSYNPNSISSVITYDNNGAEVILNTQDLIDMQTTPLNDTIMGTVNDDTLSGGKGDDFLDGGQGNDTYYYNDGDGIDRIEDTCGSDDKLIFGESIDKNDLIVKASHLGELTIALAKDNVDWKALKNKVIIQRFGNAYCNDDIIDTIILHHGCKYADTWPPLRINTWPVQ
jgi:Ca2+-binding RTX toxin-like protein